MALSIRTAADTEAERRTAADLEATVSRHDLTAWTFTNDVIIQEGAIPHSHPALTLSTRNDGDHQLSSLIHEQMHWFCADRDADAERAYQQDLRPRYPVVPVGRPDGADTEESTYLHLIVCWLEIDAVAHLLGRATAERIANDFAKAGVYGWVYRTVLNDFETLGQIYARHDLRITVSG